MRAQRFEGRIEQHKGWLLLTAWNARSRTRCSVAAPQAYSIWAVTWACSSKPIIKKDRNQLQRYGHACVDNMYRRIVGYNAQVVTYSLVQGKAFGGGFECALASETIIAEESATFSFPEVLFNMFPGMGALTLLGRRIGLSKAEDVIMSGKVFTAREMRKLGVVDEIARRGGGRGGSQVSNQVSPASDATASAQCHKPNESFSRFGHSEMRAVVRDLG